jgi:hypothetical protein
MAVGGRLTISVEYDSAGFDELNGAAGPVVRYLTGLAQEVVQEAKRLAPTSADGSHGRPSGYLRSAIGYTVERDSDGEWVARIETPATTPTGKPYGLFQEVGWTKMNGQAGKHTPHLRPALDRLT